MSALQLTPGDVKLDQLSQVYRFGAAVTLDPSCRPAVENAAAQIAAAAAGDVPVYGVNTGLANSPRSRSRRKTQDGFRKT